MWTDEAELAAARERVDGWESALTERAARSRDLSTRLARLTATATSADRTVEVTVDAAGRLVALRLDERVRAASAARTAERVLATTREAYAELLRQVTAATRAALGPDDPAATAIIGSYDRRFGADGAAR
jgi:hypothetical protein